MTTDHNPFAVAEQLAPVPATREQATAHAWVRHHAATALAAFAEFDRQTHDLPPNPQKGSRPDLGYLVALGVAATHAAVALAGERADTPERLWDLTPEAGALNGEWEEWLADTLDRHGINPADINPEYNAADFRSPTTCRQCGQPEDPGGRPTYADLRFNDRRRCPGCIAADVRDEPEPDQRLDDADEDSAHAEAVATCREED